MHAMRFDGQADVLFIVWNDRAGKQQTIRYTKDNLVSVTSLMGNTVELKADSSREAQMEIDEASGPIYLLWKHPPASAHDGAATSVRMTWPAGNKRVTATSERHHFIATTPSMISPDCDCLLMAPIKRWRVDK
jgi:hypothetical protein